MNFTVVWFPDCERELAALWLVAPDRNAVTAAAALIDRQLADDPENVGESRGDGRRIIIAPPLAATYRVRKDDRIVEVINVRKLPQHKK
jgi:hypothetical protein